MNDSMIGRSRPGSQTGVFSQLVRDHMRQALVVVRAGTSCADMVAATAEAAASSAIVVGDDGRPLGIITEQDICRRIAFRQPEEAPVEEVMSAPVMTIRDSDYLYHAIARMRARKLRHMPVVDDAGAVVGILDLSTAFAVALGPVIRRIDRLTREDTLDGIREVKAAQVEVAHELLAESVPAPEIQGLLSHVNTDIYRRLTELALRDMRAAGWNDPPVSFAVIVMGSGGRGESFLYPDQDNGIILADYPDDEHNRVDSFFREFADRLVTALDAVGFPSCRGNVMATNPLWRKTLTQWRQQIDYWVRKRNHVTLRLSDIFFDFRGAYGEDDFVRQLRRHITERLRGNIPFLQGMYRLDEDRKVALGLFGRLIGDRQSREHWNEINLKLTGTLPLVEAIRVLALREGIPETTTLGRIAALHAAGILDDNSQDYLVGAFHHITFLLLRQQLADFRSGRKVGNHVPRHYLSKRERDILIDSFKAISDLRSRVRSELTGELF